MTIHLLADGSIELEGACPIEDAETLLQHLVSRPDIVVDWRKCAAAHTAVIQVLLMAKPTLRGLPASEFLRTFVAPILAANLS